MPFLSPSILVITSLQFVNAILMYYIGNEDEMWQPKIEKRWHPNIEKRWQSNIIKHLNYSVPDEPVSGFRDNMQRGKCNKSSFITVEDIGQLGNQMNEYASLLSYAKRLNMTPFISNNMQEKLSAIFG